MNDEILTPEEASIIAGVPVRQLLRWAHDKVGPKNVGSRWRPAYYEADLKAWKQERAKLHVEG